MWAYLALLVFAALSGARAEEWRHVCVEEEIEMTCPPREVAIKNKEYKSLSLIVTDPYDASLKQYAVYCGSDPANCTRYPLKGSFVHRIKVRNPVRGKMYVIHLRKNDLLSYTCSVQLKKENRPLVYQMNVSSSMNCLTARAGQDINLSQSSEETTQTSQNSSVQEMSWYIIRPNGRLQQVVYCNPRKCIFTPCQGKSCPECLPRLKMKGLSMILQNVQQADQGLKLQCTTKPRVSRKMRGNPKVRVYHVGIQKVLSKLSTDSSYTSPGTGTQRPTRNKTTRCPSKTVHSIPTENPTANSTLWTMKTPTSAASGLLPLSVLISLALLNTLFPLLLLQKLRT